MTRWIRAISILSILPLLAPLSTTPLPASGETKTETVAAKAIEQVARDFVDGAAVGDVDRVLNAIDPGVQMLSIGKLPNGRSLVAFTTYSQLVETVAAQAGREAAGDAGVTVLEVYDNTSSVFVKRGDAAAYLHVARLNDRWRIVNLLRVSDPEAPSKEDRASIERSGMDYVDGFYESSPDREIRALYPSLHKVVVRSLPGGREFLNRIDRLTLEEATRAGLGGKPPAERGVSVRILHASGDAAAIAIPSADFYDLAHVARINGEWKIVNVLWVPN